MSGESLDAAREAFANQRWSMAYELLLGENRQRRLPLDDLERLAVAAHLTGRESAHRDALLQGHRESLLQGEIARAEARLESGRCYWYENVRAAWATVSAGDPLSLEQRAKLKVASLTAVENSVDAVDILHRLAGTTAIFQSSPLERGWRDVHTAAQHQQVQDARWENAGRVLFGLEPNNPFI